MTTITCPVREAAMRLGLEFIESLFYRAALEQGFKEGSEQRARELFQTFSRGEALPGWCANFVVRVNEGKYGACPECGSQSTCHHSH